MIQVSASAQDLYEEFRQRKPVLRAKATVSAGDGG
jgi:hypothetical protein